MKILENTYYIGVNDYDVDLFEGQYLVPDGISYNSYVIVDEKVAVMDTVATNFTEEWLSKLEAVLDGRTVDYLIVHHMEPDHSANIANFLNKYPCTTIVATAKAFQFMEQFFGVDFAELASGEENNSHTGNSMTDRRLVVTEGSKLSLGTHTLHFYTAPMVHWPEVMVTYDDTTRALFSADGFGTFGVPKSILSDANTKDTWSDEARRYYIGIVGKYGPQVQMLLKKLANLDVTAICPLHGPVLTQDLVHYIELYNTWSSYMPEKDGVVIAYASIYGNTGACAEQLCKQLTSMGCENVKLYDLARTEFSTVVAEAFRCSKLVLASATYNADLFPPMQHLIGALKERNFQNRKVAFIENGTWAPMAAKLMKERLESCKNLTFCENIVTIKSKMDDADVEKLELLAKELME